MNRSNREKREWGLILVFIPIGFLLMTLAGHLAIRVAPFWSVNANMRSKLDPETASRRERAPVQPLSAEILTPLAWFDTFLTPQAVAGGEVVYPEFVVLEPSATPSLPPSPPAPSATPSASVTPPPSETPTATPSASPTVSPTSSPTAAKPPKDDPTPPAPTGTPTASPTSPPATLDPSLTPATAIVISTDTPDNVTSDIPPGRYVVMDMSGNPVVVSNTPDGNYDMIFYEWRSGGAVYLDHIIIGISHDSNGATYWEVFNWGNNQPDTNTNVSVTPEADNATFTNLYPTPAATGTPVGTGVLIDVDTAPSAPPPGSYNYVVVISPISGDMDAAQVDSIVVTEVPIP